jgi:hypothetical protein
MMIHLHVILLCVIFTNGKSVTIYFIRPVPCPQEPSEIRGSQVMTVKIKIFWDVTPCSLVDIY